MWSIYRRRREHKMINKKQVNKILKIITSSPALKVFKETQKIELLKFYNQLEALLKMDIPYGEVGEKIVLCIALTFGDQGEWNIFQKGELVRRIKEGLLDENNIILSNPEGNVITVIKGTYINDYVEAEEFSEKESLLVFFIKYMEFHLFINGKAIHYIANIMRPSREGVDTPEILPAREYRKLITNHHDRHVYKEAGSFKYWKKKPERILIDNPEIQFNKNLYSYLDLNVVDGHVDRGAPISGAEDIPDIRIITYESGDIYIIEIKCLGKTDSTKYYDDWANKGLFQLGIYLKDEKDSKTGVLVLYDGRKESKDIIWDHEIEWHPKMDRNPMRFFLESESASVKAKTIYTALKRKKRGL